MNKMNRFKAGLVAIAALTLPVLTNGCGDDGPLGGGNALCCNENDFKIGGTVTGSLSGNAQAQVAAQAVADFAGIASAAVDDITSACRSIAQDLDAAKAEQDAAEAQTDRRARLKAWCELAIKQVGTVKAVATANGQLTISLVVEGPQCSASISAKASCEGKCDVSGKCDIKANPPKCTGGKLEIACKGSCTAMAGATVSCEGQCMGNCSGECTAQGGVQCQGECEGTCEGAGGAGTSGVDATGKCTGTCKGTCKATAPSVMCQGSCKGSCSASCQASANASVKCDGMCSGEFEPLRCEGGKLEGGCNVEAKCKANCDASVSAKAECTPPRVTYALTGGASASVEAVAAFGRLKATFEANLPLVFSFLGRLDGMVDVGGSLAGNIEGLTDIKLVCIPVVAKAASEGFADVQASFEFAGKITTSAK